MILLMLAALVAADDSPARQPEPSQPVVVSSLTTAQLVQQCRGKDEDVTPNFCTGYIIAAFDTLSLSQQICPSPILSTATGAIATTRKYLRTHAEDSQAAPAFIVRASLKRTYPCERR